MLAQVLADTVNSALVGAPTATPDAPAPPELVTVIVETALWDPTFTDPNATLLGDACRLAEAAPTPVPVIVIATVEPPEPLIL